MAITAEQSEEMKAAIKKKVMASVRALSAADALTLFERLSDLF